MTRLAIYAVVLLAIIGACGAYIHKAKEDAREEVRAEWKASTILAAEESRREVERVKAQAQRQREEDKQERERKADEERQRFEQAIEQQTKKTSDLRKRFEHELATNSDCAAQMQQVLLCPIE